ncbi:MAG: apolipoprotein N-acyltransferase, partial [Thermodesulfobacteriota bacterium]
PASGLPQAILLPLFSDGLHGQFQIGLTWERMPAILASIMKKDILLSLLSGFCLVFAFPKFDVNILAWIAFLPLFYALQHKTLAQAAGLGFIAGCAFFSGLLYWIYNVLTIYGHLPGIVSVFFFILLTAYLALYFSCFAFVWRWLDLKNSAGLILFAPAFWVSLEYIRGILFSGFPWELLGYSQYRVLPLIQVADLTGVYGVSFLIVLVNILFFRALVYLGQGEKKSAGKEILTVAIIILCCWVYGQIKIASLEQISAKQKDYKISLIQGNIRQDLKWERHFQEETLRIYTALTWQTKKEKPDLVIWPETATPFFFQNNFPFQSRILDLAAQMETPLLFGSPAFTRQDHKVNYFNSAFLISPQKEILGRYDKIHLVPFGEYAPLAGLLGFTRDIIGAIGDFTPGLGVTNLALPWGKFGVLICYEIIFPNLTRQFAAQGAQFLVNITNDAWFGRTSAPYQHLSMATLRAVENRLPIARAANTGISAIINAEGKIVQSSNLFTREVLSGNIKINTGLTFYTRYGDIFAYLCLVISGLYLISIYWRRG